MKLDERYQSRKTMLKEKWFQRGEYLKIYHKFLEKKIPEPVRILKPALFCVVELKCQEEIFSCQGLLLFRAHVKSDSHAGESGLV